MTAVHFNYSFGDHLYPCTYDVQADQMTVAAIGNTQTIPLRQTDDPQRLARVVAHDILTKADKNGLL